MAHALQPRRKAGITYSVHQGRARPCHYGARLKRTASGRARVAIVVFVETIPPLPREKGEAHTLSQKAFSKSAFRNTRPGPRLRKNQFGRETT